MATRLTTLETNVTNIENDIKIFDVDETTNTHVTIDARLDVVEGALNMASSTNEIDNRLMNLEKAITGEASDGTAGNFK